MNACIAVGIPTRLVGIHWCILSIGHYRPHILVEVACSEVLLHLLLLLLQELQQRLRKHLEIHWFPEQASAKLGLTHLLLPLQQRLPEHQLGNVMETFSVQELQWERHVLASAVQWDTNWYDWSESSWLCQEESGDSIRLSC
jgi:hypothetical protein